MPELLACQGCGARVPDEDGPTHDYMLSAPVCWRTYGELQARFGAEGVGWRTRKLAADAYAVQHPGVPGPRSSQSVVVPGGAVPGGRAWPDARGGRRRHAAPARRLEGPLPVPRPA